MRLHRLHLEAFGPFPAGVEVDFDALSSAGLFLIQGPTGSGKTSLLDGVSFALFGDVPGDRSKKDLHSDHAAAGAVPLAELELTSSGRRLRIRRSPEFYRPKKKGLGTVRVNATVSVEEYRGGAWEAVSSGHGEADELIADVVGMGKDQFAKVALLPQGEFAAFLKATPEDRRTLLERLFDISSYAGIEEWLAQARRDCAAEVEKSRALLETEVERVRDVLGQSLPVESGLAADSEESGAADLGEAASLSSTDPDLLSRLDQFTDQVSSQVSAALVCADEATLREDEARRLAESGRALQLVQARGSAASAELTALAADDDAREDDRQALELSRKAESLAGHLAARAREVARLEQAKDAVGQRAGSLSPLAGSGLDPDSPIDAWSAALLAVTSHDGALAEAVRLHRESVRRSQRIASLSAQHEPLTLRRDALESDIAMARRRLEPLVDASARCAAARDEADLAGQRLDEARRLRDIAVRGLDETDAASAATTKASAARERSLAARETLVSLQTRRIEGMAAELAAGLHPGDSCPVCGSSEHPDLAQAADPITAEQVEAQSRVVESFSLELEALNSHRDTAVARAAATQAQLPKGATAEALEASLVEAIEWASECAARCAVAEGEVTQAAALQKEITESEQELQRIGTELEGLAGARSELQELAASGLAELRVALAGHERDCPCLALAGREPWDVEDPDVLHAVEPLSIEADHRTAADSLEDYLSALRSLEAATERAAEATSVAQGAAVDAGFPSAEEAASALLPAADATLLRERVAAHDQAKTAALATLAEDDVQSALAQDAPDVDALADGARRARAALFAAKDASTRAQTIARDLESQRQRIANTLAQLVPAQARHAQLKDLADTLAGTSPNNALRMRLTSFVLAGRLEKVVALANERLRFLGQGRYLLEHSDALAARGARSGLSLVVLDQWTGRSRATSTLSGGEAFTASLALALGLADAVREEAGGRSLGTLFIDEGFGSLDEDTLDEVLGVLDQLREGGRAVGVVSHVAELRSRITSQVVVSKSATGSTIQVQTPNSLDPVGAA